MFGIAYGGGQGRLRQKPHASSSAAGASAVFRKRHDANGSAPTDQCCLTPIWGDPITPQSSITSCSS
jgi:hypothetical protein